MLERFQSQIGREANLDMIVSVQLQDSLLSYHKTVEVGRDLWDSSCPYCCSSKAISLFLPSEIQDFLYHEALYLQSTQPSVPQYCRKPLSYILLFLVSSVLFFALTDMNVCPSSIKCARFEQATVRKGQGEQDSCHRKLYPWLESFPHGLKA